MKNDKKNSKKENKRGFSIRSVLDFVSTFVVTAVIIIAIALTVLHFAGIKGFTIESNSMAPIYPTNSFVLVKETMPDEIDVGDIITYVFNEEGILVTHRVISVDSESKAFITKGDNNNVQDPEPILWDNVVGKAVFGIPKIGTVMRVLTDQKNRPYIFGVIIAIGITSLVWDLIEKNNSKKEELNEKE